MNKITKFLIIVLVVLAFIYFLLNRYTTELEDMSSKVGAKQGGGELSMNDYYEFATYFDIYKQYVEKSEYKAAYNMLGASYRRYISYEDYEKNISQKEIENLELKDINIITSTTFDCLTDASGDKQHYTIIVDKLTDKASLYPDSFLDYKVLENSQKTRNVECILKDYVVNIDKCTLNFEVINKNNTNLNIVKSTLYTNLNDIITLEENISLTQNENKKISLYYDTEYAFPEKLILECQLDGKKLELEFVF